jgi:hypothetical protein
MDFIDNAVQIGGDTAFQWPGPHKVGSIFTGSFEFTPLRSGDWDITLYCRRPAFFHISQQIKAGIGFRWRLSPEGELRYLGKQGIVPDGCMTPKSFFYKGDSIHIKPSSEASLNSAFQYSVLIEPIPKIGDTSTVHYYLRANKDIPEGCDIIIGYWGIEVSSPPKAMAHHISKGEQVELSLKIIPMPINSELSLNLMITYGLDSRNRPNSQSIANSFIFNNDSTLKLISDRPFPPFQEDLFPNKLQPRESGIGNVIDIRRDDKDSL